MFAKYPMFRTFVEQQGVEFVSEEELELDPVDVDVRMVFVLAIEFVLS